MRNFLLFIGFYFMAMTAFAQQTQSLKENEPQIVNGIEMGFRINKESAKKAGDEEYSRYVLEVYAINKSDCSKYIYYQNDGSSYGSGSANLIATFYVRNANGKRFTSRDAKLNAKDWWVRVKVTEKDSNGKDVTGCGTCRRVIYSERATSYVIRLLYWYPKANSLWWKQLYNILRFVGKSSGLGY